MPIRAAYIVIRRNAMKVTVMKYEDMEFKETIFDAGNNFRVKFNNGLEVSLSETQKGEIRLSSEPPSNYFDVRPMARNSVQLIMVER